MSEETYAISVQCHNCKYILGKTKYGDRINIIPKQIVIPKGTEVKMFLREMTCENCGCNGFMGIL